MVSSNIPNLEKEYLIVSPSFRVYDPKDYKFKPEEKNFEYLVRKKALRETVSEKREPDALEYIKRFGIDWESMSDVGHMHFQPQACLIFDLVSNYAWKKANSLDIPVYPVRGSNIFRLSERPVREHADLFGDRLYKVDVEDESYVMRYAACHQAFAILRNWNISYRNLPFGVYENADSYRLEQSGELLLCFRTRKMHMPDLHVLCRDLGEAKDMSLKVHKKIYEEFEINLGRMLVDLYNITPSFFEENQDYIKELLKIERKPILVRFVPEGKYYWVINVEHHIIDAIKNPREIGTFQIDVGNAERFGIKYTTESGEERYTPIIHTALIGTIERYLYTIFDSVARKRNMEKPPSLPTWLTPTQVRLIPVSEGYLEFLEGIYKELSNQNIRVDIDDRPKSVARKIVDAERELIPYTLVIGEQEREFNLFKVRRRERKTIEKLSIDQLVENVKGETKGKPFIDSYLPKNLSQRPTF